MASSQTFQDHIHELRRRIMFVVLAMGISATIAYISRNSIIELLQHPLGAPLFYSSPGGGFNFVIKLSMIIGMFVALPVIIYQLVGFIEPALPMRIKTSTMLKIMGASFVLACTGILFGYFYIIPESLKFFGGFSTSGIKPLISADSYLSYVINTLITFAMTFQIPLIVLFIDWIKPLKPGPLLKYQRHVIVAAFAIALILPFTYDPISQFMVALPIIVLYYVSVILLCITNRARRKKSAKLGTFTIASPPQPTPVAVPVSKEEPKQPPVPAVPATSTVSGRSLDGIRPATSSSKQIAVTERGAPQPLKQRPIVVNKRPTQRLTIDGFFPSLT